MKILILMMTVMVLLEARTVSAREDIVDTIGEAGEYGVWGPWEYCPTGSYAAGYGMKVEGDRGGSNKISDFLRNRQGNDDTAVNGIKLICRDKDSDKRVHKITSNVGEYGSWREEITCIDGFLKSVRFKNEPPQGDGDDTGTNSVKFICSNSQEIQANGTMPWGSWGQYRHCPGASVICGIQTRVEEPIGGRDDTSLNGTNFKCCSISL